MVRCDSKTTDPQVYRGLNTAEHFLRQLQKVEEQIKHALPNTMPMKMTKNDQIYYSLSTVCHIYVKNHLVVILFVITVT